MTPGVAYFVRTAEGRLLPQAACAGAWNVEELHVSPVNGVLFHELERWLRVQRPDGHGAITRITFEYMGVIDFTECDVAIDWIRPGRAVELVEGVLTQHGRPVLRLRAWLVASTDTSAVAGGEHDPLAPPDEAAPFDMTSTWPGAYIGSLETRALHGPTPGRTTAWLTTPLAIVTGEPVSDLARFVLLVDTANGIAVRRSPDEWQFPNVDLAIQLFRQPAGRWAGFDTRVVFGPTGQGLTSSDLFDEHGHVGHAEQALLLRPRR